MLYETQYRVIPPKGAEKWISSIGHAQYDAAGNPTRTLGVIIDITRRRKEEQELQDLRLELAHVDRVHRVGAALLRVGARTESSRWAPFCEMPRLRKCIWKMEHLDREELMAIVVDIRKDDQRAGQVINRMRSLMKRRVVEQQIIAIGPFDR